MTPKHDLENQPATSIWYETRLGMTEAARLIPSKKQGKPTHVSTVKRWILRGSRGVRLEGIRVGGQWITSREALERFSAALTARYLPSADHLDASTIPSNPSSPSIDVARRRHLDRVDSLLTELGL